MNNCADFPLAVVGRAADNGISDMTYYSDLLIVIGELEALEYGRPPSRSLPELRALCRELLAIDPDEFLAEQLLATLDAVPDDVSREALKVFTFDRLPKIFRR